jgi:hypothetical protein
MSEFDSMTNEELTAKTRDLEGDYKRTKTNITRITSEIK